MLEVNNWTLILVTATVAATLAGVGLVGSMILPAEFAALSAAALGGALTASTAAFSLVALRLRRLELENEGLVEELSQEFDRVKEQLEVEPRSYTPDGPAARAVQQRVMVK